MPEFPDSSEMAELNRFVDANISAAPDRLRLKYHNDSRQWIPLAINHIEAVQMGRVKLAGLIPSFMPSPLAVEQATSAQVARLHGHIAREVAPECRSFVDLTCGLGIDCRAIAEELGATAAVTAVEINPMLAAAAVYNFAAAGLEKIKVVESDCVEWLENRHEEHFDLAFIDPARRGSKGERVYNIHACQPDVSLMSEIFRRCMPVVMVKLSPMLDVTQTLRDLPQTVALHVVDDGNECRELLAILDFRDNCMPRGVNAPVIVHSSGRDPLRFTLAENADAEITIGIPYAGMYMFEPSAAAMKASPFGVLCQRFGLRKLHANTNLFIAAEPETSLPGRWYEIAEVLDYSSKNIRAFASRYPRADVAVRNFPLPAADLQKRLRVKPGGDLRVIGVTLRGDGRMASQGNQALLVLRKK